MKCFKFLTNIQHSRIGVLFATATQREHFREHPYHRVLTLIGKCISMVSYVLYVCTTSNLCTI